MSLGEKIDVQDRFFGIGHASGLAAEARVLKPLSGAGQVLESSVAIRYRDVVLLNVRQDLVVQDLLQRLGAPHRFRGVRILRFQVREHAGGTLVSHPGVVIVQLQPVHGCALRLAWRDRGFKKDRFHEISRNQDTKEDALADNARLAEALLSNARTKDAPQR